jgi:hypothetical protein
MPPSRRINNVFLGSVEPKIWPVYPKKETKSPGIP